MADGGEDDEAGKHPGGPGHERLAPAKVLDDVEPDEGDEEVDGVEDDLRHEAVDLDGAEDGGAVVEEVVGARELLEHLERDAERDAARHLGRGEHGGELAHGAELDRVLGAQLGLDLLELRVDGPVVRPGAVHFTYGVGGAVGAAVAEVEARRLGEGQDAQAQDQRPHPAQADDDAPAGRVAAVVRDGAVVEGGGEEDAHGDEELVRAHHGAADPGRRRLGLVHGHQQAQRADAQPGDEAPNHDLVPRRHGRNLHHEPDRRHQAPYRHRRLAPDAVRHGRRRQRPDERADGQQRHDEPRAHRRKVLLPVVGVGHAEPLQEVGHLENPEIWPVS